MEFDGKAFESRGLQQFVTTHWSVVLSARDPKSPQSRIALETLCRHYWEPLYAYVRRRGHSPHNAQDLTQEFFARLIEKDSLQSVDPEKGRFRTFLLVLMQRFLADEWDRASAKKRGAGKVLSVDFSSAEAELLSHTIDHMDPEKAYNRQWALKVLTQTYQRMEQEYSAAGKATVFASLRFALTGSRSEISYVEHAKRLGVSEGAVKVAVHRLRQRYREVLREIVAETVASPDEVEDELRHMLSALST